MNGYLAGCYLKTRFPSRRTGRRRARQIRGQGGPHLHAYRCRYCHGVHIGHGPGQASHIRSGLHGIYHVQELTP